MSAFFNWLEALPGYQFAALLVSLYAALGLLCALADEWERRQR